MSSSVSPGPSVVWLEVRAERGVNGEPPPQRAQAPAVWGCEQASYVKSHSFSSFVKWLRGIRDLSLQLLHISLLRLGQVPEDSGGIISCHRPPNKQDNRTMVNFPCWVFNHLVIQQLIQLTWYNEVNHQHWLFHIWVLPWYIVLQTQGLSSLKNPKATAKRWADPY